MTKIIMAQSLMNKKFEAEQYLIEGLISRGDIGSIVGSSETGKSMLLRDMGISVASGEEKFLGFKINRSSGVVVYISTEDGERRTKETLDKQFIGRNIEKINANLGFLFETDDIIKELNNLQVSRKIDLVIIDCFSDLFKGDLNRTNEVRAFLNPYKEFARKNDSAIIFLHHIGKSGELKAPNKNNILGSQGYESSMRFVAELRKDKYDSDKRHFCITKANGLPDKYKQSSLVLNFDPDKFTYTNTWESKKFSELADDSPRREDLEKYQKIVSLSREGVIQSEIAKQVGYEAKSSVSKLLKKGQKENWDTLFSDLNKAKKLKLEDEIDELPF